MTATDEAPTPLRDVLYDFSLAKEVPDAELLEEFTKLYPSYADDLVEFAIELFVDAQQESADIVEPFDEATVSPAVSRATSAFQVALQEARGQEEVAGEEKSVGEESSVENPFADMDRRQFRALADAVNVSTLFLTKLRDRLINPDTMPEGFLRVLGEKMNVAVEQLESYFQAGPQLAGQQFKAETKPSVSQQQGFEDAVKGSELTEKQQQYLLDLQGKLHGRL